MKKSIPQAILTIMVILAWHKPANAQYIIKEADTQFELFNYSKAIDLYEQAYKKKATLHAAERLAECNALVHHYKETESWYAIAVSIPGSNMEDHLNYARALQNNSKYMEAKIQFQEYARLNAKVTPEQKQLWELSCDSAVLWMKAPRPYGIKNEKRLNTPQSDWGAVPWNNAIVYASDRGAYRKESPGGDGRPFLKFDGAKTPDKNHYGWTGNKYLRLYIDHNDQDSSTLFPLNAGTEYHIGAASFTGDGRTMYFTLTRVPSKPIYINGKLATINVEIYSSHQDAASCAWSVPVPFKFNNINQWSVGDPFITADGGTLYFVSNKPGGKGGTDIYVCHQTDSGEWNEPQNLSDINTSGNERTPALDAYHNLYFSSDGYVGMGGLDIFKSVDNQGKFGKPQNLGYPLNSPQDDFACLYGSETTGYFASDRTDGLGQDDIYSFEMQKILHLKLTGIVYNKKMNIPLANALVSLQKQDGGILRVQTDASGAFKFDLDEASDYSLTGEKTNFQNDIAEITTAKLAVSTTLQQNLYLEPVEIEKAIRLEDIYYDFDKWNIRKDASVALDKLVKIMKDNPTMWIELGAHTDSRGNDAYNMILSQKRAESAVQYIISKGINRNRITAKGYGETQLLNKCANGVLCSELDHQLNRRTEFKIVKQ